VTVKLNSSDLNRVKQLVVWRSKCWICSYRVLIRGRPRKTWMEGVRAAMKTRHLEVNQWLNGKEWCLGSGRRRQLSQDRKDR